MARLEDLAEKAIDIAVEMETETKKLRELRARLGDLLGEFVAEKPSNGGAEALVCKIKLVALYTVTLGKLDAAITVLGMNDE